MIDKNENIQISVIIPVYNIENYIEKCVQSILNQDLKEIEIILVDDGSTDNSPIICDKLKDKDPRVKVIHKKNGGVNTARNTGLDIANGKWISFIDGDDLLAPETLKSNLALIEKNPEIDILQLPVLTVKGDISTPRPNYPENFIIIKDVCKNISLILDKRQVLPGELWGKLYKKSIWDNRRLREDMQFCEDAYTITDILESGAIFSFSQKGAYLYVSNPNSALNSKFTPKRSLDVARLKFKFFLSANKHNIDTQRWWEESTKTAIEAWAYYGKTDELKDIFNYLNNIKSKFKIKKTLRPVLNLAILTSPQFAASLYSCILKIKSHK